MKRSPAGIQLLLLAPAIRHRAPILALGIGCVLGCISGQDAPPPADACSPHVSNGTLPESVSFRTDIMPVFLQSCALFRYCHDGSGHQGGLYLGPTVFDPAYPPTEMTFAQVRAALVDAASVRAVSMVRVSPGSPEHSFLMHKVDADQNCSDILCKHPLSGMTGTDLCGDRMPPGGAAPLDAAGADLIRAWIAEGALDN